MMADPNQRLWLWPTRADSSGWTRPTSVGSGSPRSCRSSSVPSAARFACGGSGLGLDLFAALDQQDAHVAAGDLASLDLPVTLIFGATDDYLSPDLARHLAGLFPHADVHPIDDASQWPQWDQPAIVARLIKQAASK